MSALPWLFTDDLRLMMTCRARPDERDIRHLAWQFGRSRADVRRRRRSLRRAARRAEGRGGRR